MKKYELIIFDCDGTLVDSEHVTNRLIASLINERGISINYEECLERFAGKTIGHITDFIKQTHPDHDDALFEKEYRRRSKQMFIDELEAVKGAKELLESLKIPFCVASNGPKVKMETTLPAAGLDKYFDASNTFSAYDIQVWKPQPDLFLHAAARMKVDPSKALVIEDTWSGAMGAINGAIDVWVYNAHFDKRVYLNGVPNFSKMSSIQELLYRSV